MDLKNRVVKRGYVIPAVIAVIFTICAVLFLVFGTSNIPFSERYSELSVTDSNEIIERTDIEKGSEVSKSSFGHLQKNTLLGLVTFGDTPVSLTYNPYESVAADSVALDPEHQLPGEAGVTVLSLTKNNSGLLKNIEEGDTVKISTIYSNEDYTLEARKTEYFNSFEEAKSLADGLGTSVVIIADSSYGVSVGVKYLAVAFDISGGAEVTA